MRASALITAPAITAIPSPNLALAETIAAGLIALIILNSNLPKIIARLQTALIVPNSYKRMRDSFTSQSWEIFVGSQNRHVQYRGARQVQVNQTNDFVGASGAHAALSQPSRGRQRRSLTRGVK